jgi:hypothetical protein
MSTSLMTSNTEALRGKKGFRGTSGHVVRILSNFDSGFDNRVMILTCILSPRNPK